MDLWIARNKDGKLNLFKYKPTKYITSWGAPLCSPFDVSIMNIDVDQEELKDIRWEDEEATRLFVTPQNNDSRRFIIRGVLKYLGDHFDELPYDIQEAILDFIGKFKEYIGFEGKKN